MAADSIGSVSVDIRGDYSKLQADFAGAQALATKAGAGIAAGLTGGMTPALKGASGLVDQFGRSIGAGVTAPVTAATPPVLSLTAGIQRLIIAQELLRVATGATVPVIEAQGAAATHGATQIQAVGGAIRTAFGDNSIRAVERFLTMIPGVGNVLQKAFPLIGAVALIEMFSRVMSKSDGVKQAMQELKTAVEATDKAFADLVKTGDQLLTHAATRDVGAASGAQARVDALKGDIATVSNEILAKESESRNAANVYNAEHPKELLFKGTLTGPQYESEEVVIKRKQLAEDIKALTARQAALQGQANSANEDARKAREERTGALGGAQIAGEIAAGEHLAAQRKAWTEDQIARDHHAQQMRIIEITDTGTRSVAEAEEELRVAQATQAAITTALAAEVPKRIKLIREAGAAEGAGKSDQEKTLIGVQTGNKVEDFQAQSDQKSIEASKAAKAALFKLEEAHVTATRGWAEEVTREWEKSFEARRKDAQRTFEEENAGDAHRVLAAQAVAEIQSKSKGDLDALNTLKQKIELEGRYANQLAHDKAQEIQFARDVAALDSKARQDRIAGEEAKRAPMVAELPAEGDPAYVKKKEEIATLEARIAEMRAKANNDDEEALNRINALVRQLSNEWQANHIIRQTLDNWKDINAATVKLQVAQAALRVPDAIGGAVAGGLFNSGKQGMDIGKQVGDAMKNIGKQLAGELIADAIKKLLAEAILHTGLQAALNALFPAVATGQTTALLAGMATVVTTPIVTAITAAGGASAAGGAAGGVGGAVGGIAGSAGGAASSAASGLIGPLIAAAGGIIGGVISGVMSLIGAHQIVTAIHGTTAAVQALHGTVSGSSTPVTSGVPSTPAATTGGASQGGFIGFFASILGLGGAKPIDVNIVGISPLSPLKGLFNLFGFASGGRPPLGMASIVGERGPELFIPDQAGQIIPAGKWGGAGVGLPSISGVSSSSSQSIGELHVHAHGITNPKEFVRQVARELPNYLKTTSPVYGPASR